MTNPHNHRMTKVQREAARARRRLLKLAKRQIREEEAARAVPHPGVDPGVAEPGPEPAPAAT
jgi:hypothetical protein